MLLSKWAVMAHLAIFIVPSYTAQPTLQKGVGASIFLCISRATRG